MPARKKTNEAKAPSMADFATSFMMGNPALTKAWSDLMAENVRFLSDRLEQDFETQKAMLACKTPADVMKVQSEFFQKAVEDYSGGAQRVFEILTAASTEAVEGAKSSFKRGYDDVPL